MPQRVFSGVDLLLPEAIAAGLSRLLPSGIPDLGRILLVLPGKVARRNVQSALLKYIPGGVLLPQMLTPHLLLHYGRTPGKLPDTLSSLIIWQNTLNKAAAHPENYSLIFPGSRMPGEKLPAAGVMHDLRHELSAGGFSIAEVADMLGSRGDQLAALEKLFCEELVRCGYDDPLVCDRLAAMDTEPFAGVDKIILAGVPDVPRMLREKLQAIDLAFPGKLEIWIADREENAGFYDQWGVPVPELWEKRSLLIPWENLHTVLDPEDAARKAIQLASDNGKFSPDECAVVLADPSLYPDFTREFSRIKSADSGTPLAVIDPSGIAFSGLRLGKLARTLLDMLKNRNDFLYAAELVRNRDFALSLVKKPELIRQLLIELDDFQQQYTPDDLRRAVLQASGVPQVEYALQQVCYWEEKFSALELPDFLRKFFTAVYLDAGDIGQEECAGVSFDDECDFFTGQLEILEKLPPELIAGVDKSALLESFMQCTLSEKLSVSTPGDAIAFEGRLEMPFLNQKRLIFCGMNEKYFPDKIDITPFLTDTLRQKIGIRSNRETLVRSLCHLESVRALRKSCDLHLLVLRQDREKSTLRPSSLLFAGEDLPETELLSRSGKLFRDPVKLELPEADHEGRVFKLRITPDFRRTADGEMLLSVTDLDEYLKNGPFDFYWKRVLKCDKVDYSMCEPDARLQGILCHRAFELLGQETFTTEEKLREKLLEHFDHALGEFYGELPAMVKLFAANMKQRLEYASEKLFQLQQQGYQVIANEYRFGGDEKRQLAFAGAVFRGSIDRIEYNPATRTLRITDIKTGKVDNVIAEHCKISGDEVKFSRLQLPLYALLLQNDPFFRKKFGIDPAECRLECAYLLLPRSVTDTGIQLWPAEELAAILPAAENCIRSLIGEIRKFPAGVICQDPSTITNGLFRPDATAVLQGVTWDYAVKEKKTPTADPSGKSTGGSAGKVRQFPLYPRLSPAGKTRCCDCPAQISTQCVCHHGDCSSCRSFNGFKAFNIITASAGTGKTYSLASRFIQLLSFGVEPETVLAITFTKKAAGEIFDRIVKRLRELIIEPERPANRCLRISPHEAAVLLRKLLGSSGELQISTIDSFFMRLLQSFAPELGIWGTIRMIDENDDRTLRKCLRNWILDAGEEELDTLRELLKDANASEQQSFYASVLTLLNKVYSYFLLNIHREPDGSMPQLEARCWSPSSADVMPPEECRRVTALLLDRAAEYENTPSVNRSIPTLIRRLRELAAGLKKSESGYLFGRLDEGVKELFSGINKNNPVQWCDNDDGENQLSYVSRLTFDPELSGALIRSYRHIRALAFLQMHRKSRAVFALMEKFDRLYSRQVRSTGNLTFTDLPGMLLAMDPETREMMLGPADHSLEFRLDSRISHYMFDEFQDTSDAQFMAFDPLLKELFSTAGGDDFRSFFCVGDVKQSIYQWRGGNPELFNYVYGQLQQMAGRLGYDPGDSLSCSYRSSQVVLNVVNAVFADEVSSMPHFNEVQRMMKFLPHISFDPELSGHAAVLEVPPVGTSGQNLPAKARIIAGILQEIDPFNRNLTVGILVQTNENARRLAEELRRLTALPISIDGRITPVNSMAFQVFRELLVLAEHPGDVEAENFLESLTFDLPGSGEPVLKGKAMLASMFDFSPELQLDEAVRNELAGCGLAGFAARFCEVFGRKGTEFDRRHLKIMLDVAENFSGSIQDFLRQIEFSGESGSSLDNTIQVMTCHKSKGLEFDIVFLPDVGNRRGNHVSLTPDAEIFDYSNSSYADGMKRSDWVSYLPAEVICQGIPPYREHIEKSALSDAFAKCCSLYVAMTRAKRALYMLLSCSKTSTSLALDKLVQSRLPEYGVRAEDQEFFRNMNVAGFSGDPVTLTFSAGDFRWYVPEITSEKPSGEVLHLPEAVLPEKKIRRASELGHSRFVPVPERRFQSGGAGIGTEVHRLFEQIRFIDDEFSAGNFCAANGVSPEAAEIFCNALHPGSAIRESLRQPEGEFELWRECRFLLIDPDGTQIPGAFDRVILHKVDGQVTHAVIYDYKSDRFQTAAEAAKYFPQLASYRKSLSSLLKLPEKFIRGKIYALRPGEIVDVF